MRWFAERTTTIQFSDCLEINIPLATCALSYSILGTELRDMKFKSANDGESRSGYFEFNMSRKMASA
ncbi:MAG: hypothetical protein DWI29_02505 [Planctomycetota bacterium]|nr:MAG: hypothetical protein DWI29_02505 [Planctomycetota bacterium]